MKRVLFTLLVALIATTIFAQTDYPVVERNGRSYYQYTIQKGDGLYAIGKKFGVTQSALFEANPGLSENIKEGAVLYIPVKATREKRKDAQTVHVVESGETPYTIAKRYGIPLDSLLRFNREIRNGLIRTGDTLIISYNKEIAAAPSEVRQEETVTAGPEFITVKPRETLYSISRQYNIAIHDIIDLNPGIEESGLKSGMQLRLRKGTEQPTPAETAKPAEPAKPEAPSEAKPTEQATPETPAIASANAFRIAYILPLTNANGPDRMFIEFYRGSLVALNRLKSEGRISSDVEVWCWDTRGSRAVLDSILRLDELKHVKVVIGPGNTSELEPVLTWCKANNKKVIVPFASKIERSWHFNNLYQFNPALEWWWERSFNTELEDQKEAVHYVIGRCGNDSRGTSYANTIARILRQKNIAFTDVNVNVNNIDSLIRAESARSNTVLLLANSNGTEVRPLIDKVAEANLWNVTLWGFSKWGNTAQRRYARTYYGSLFFDRSDDKYNTIYHNLFNAHAVGGGQMRSDLLGYDLTMFALGKSLFLQSEVNFEMIDGRWLNTTIYKLQN